MKTDLVHNVDFSCGPRRAAWFRRLCSKPVADRNASAAASRACQCANHSGCAGIPSAAGQFHGAGASDAGADHAAGAAADVCAAAELFSVPLPHSHNPLSPYMPSMPPPLNLANSPRLQDLIRDGKLYISLHDAISLAIENNLDIAYFRYNFPIGQMDLLRTKAGGSANGINTAIQQSSTQGGFGSTSTGSAGAATGGAAAGAGGIVSSTLGKEPRSLLRSLPQFQGFVDHTVLTEENPFQYGVAVLEQNTIQAQAGFTRRTLRWAPVCRSVTWGNGLPTISPTTTSIPR